MGIDLPSSFSLNTEGENNLQNSYILLSIVSDLLNPCGKVFKLWVSLEPFT